MCLCAAHCIFQNSTLFKLPWFLLPALHCVRHWQDGCTGLWYAAEKGQEAVVRLLIDHKAEIDAASGVLRELALRLTSFLNRFSSFLFMLLIPPPSLFHRIYPFFPFAPAPSLHLSVPPLRPSLPPFLPSSPSFSNSISPRFFGSLLMFIFTSQTITRWWPRHWQDGSTPLMKAAENADFNSTVYQQMVDRNEKCETTQKVLIYYEITTHPESKVGTT